MNQQSITMSQKANPQNEEWRDVVGYEGLYRVSNLGRVRTLHKRGGGCLVKAKGGILRPCFIKGYYAIRLRKDGKYKQHQLHRLVAAAFVTNPNNLPFVNHIDENGLNNNANNLEWCTHQYNINFGTRTKKVIAKLSKPISQYTMSGILIQTYSSLHEAWHKTGISIAHICNVCKGKRNHAGGFVWKYA